MLVFGVFVFFKVFLVHLDTRLRVESLELIYGERDWMDVRHGNKVAEVPEPSVPTVVQLLMDAGLTRENCSGATLPKFNSKSP